MDRSERSACDGSAPRRERRTIDQQKGNRDTLRQLQRFRQAVAGEKGGTWVIGKGKQVRAFFGCDTVLPDQIAEIFAPTGYPHRKPVSRQKEPFGESPKKLRARGARNRVMPETPSRAIRSRERIKKGSSIGNRVWNHSSSPSEEAAAACTGASSKKASKIRLTVI